MRLRKSLACVAEMPKPESFDDFRRHIDPAWIVEALDATGTATIRRRRLPADQVVWIVLGMALLRDRSIVEVVDRLDIALPGSASQCSRLRRSARGYSAVVSGAAIVKARDRLGDEPMGWLFGKSARSWAHGSADRHRWRGLAIYGVDGTTLRVPDSDENREHFGLAKGGARGPSAYPMVRLVTLMALRSHLIAAAAFGPYSKGEHTYASALWPSVPDHSLCIVDRGFLAADVLIPLSRDGTNRHWLIPAKKNLKWRVLNRHGADDMIVELIVSRHARAKNPALPETWQARAILHRRKGFRPRWLLTSMLDSRAYPAHDVAALYHERWEIELGYDEIKTEMLDREEAIRTRTPERIRQEIWGILLVYNLVRLEMDRVAGEAGVEPTRISFITSLHFICDEWLWCAAASPGAIPRHLRNLRAKLSRYVLPPRRANRRYPRAVKIKMSNYPKKRTRRPRR